jgi:hypothetical protein
MAIYTQYGRYQKAKLFKEMLESAGDTYMLLGLGNPYWDDDTKDQSIPVAPYDTSMINPYPVVNGNQFLDAHINQYFSNDTGVECSLVRGRPNYQNEQSGKYLNKCKDLIPPFPCIWHSYVEDEQDSLITGTNIKQSTYQNYYIDSRTNFTEFYLKEYGNISESPIQFPTDNYERQFFSELVLRGYARNLGQGDSNLKSNVKHPAGLLGAVKVGISFVKDIGTSLDNSTYNGYVDQFWYGDRYWEVVDPNEDTLESYIDGDTNKIYPHHLLFSATINPRQLFTGNLNVDQNLIPRQIALYNKKATPTNIVNNTVVYSNGPNVYRVGDYVFNFGQYTKTDIANLTVSGQYDNAHILNFTFPCSTNNADRSDSNSYPQGDFKFILNDYIKGIVRNRHSVDRIAYIVGF